MVTFNSSTLLRENGNYLYTMQKGDSLYAIAAKLAKEQGGNATTICNELIQKNSFTTKTDDVSKTHVNKIQVGAKINLGSRFATALTKYFEGSSGVATQNQAQRFAQVFSTDPRYTDRDACNDFAAEIGTDPLCQGDQIKQNKTVALSDKKESSPVVFSYGNKREYTLAELAALQSTSRQIDTPPPSALVAEVSARGLLGLITQPGFQKQITDLLTETVPATSNATTAEAAQADDSAEDLNPVAESEDEEWTPNGTIEPRLSAADRETIRQLREASGENDPIGYDPLTGLNMTSYMNVYTDSERSDLRKALPYSLQELRAADRIEDLGKFDARQFGAVSYNGFQVLLPFGLTEAEGRDLADFLIRYHRTANPIATNRAFRAVAAAVAAKQQDFEGIMREPLSEEALALGNPQSPKSKAPPPDYELTQADYEELLEIEDSRKKSDRFLAENLIPKK